MSEPVLLHAVTGRRASELGSMLGNGLDVIVTLPSIVGPMPRVVVGVSGPEKLLAPICTGLPEGPARAEALAVRLTRLGIPWTWGDPKIVESLDALLELCHARGRSSVGLMRADPELVPELQLGSWFAIRWRGRLVRRAGSRAPGVLALVARVLRRRDERVRLACDAAFWAGVRSAASAAEWRRLTRSSYVALVYHRVAGERKPEQKRIDVSPARFAAHIRTLRLFGFRPVAPEHVLAFHANPRAMLPRRSFVLTFDDGFVDSAGALLRAAALRPQLFVCTRELGASAHWAGGEPVIDWETLLEIAASGIAIGAHARRHRRLISLADSELREELEGSIRDLRERLSDPLEVVAYPHGAHDARVRDAALRAGFQAAYTTLKGKNGAGTDRWCLRRISVHSSDGLLALLWIVLAGEAPPRLLRRSEPKRRVSLRRTAMG